MSGNIPQRTCSYYTEIFSKSLQESKASVGGNDSDLKDQFSVYNRQIFQLKPFG